MSTASTVKLAFQAFMKDCVNLCPNQTARARTSKDFLMTQLGRFPEQVDKFPDYYPERHTQFGSFARRTKKRELDDIDLMVCFSANGATYDEGYDRITLRHNNACPKLSLLTHDEEPQYINSRKLIEKIKGELTAVSQYDQAEFHRNQEAVTVKLKSYTWNFDVVPCFFTKEEYDGRTYYLIPDGNGHWKKTDPRLDKEKASRVNQNNEGNVLNVIRLVKFWNTRPTMPSISSYLLENIVLNYYDDIFNNAGACVYSEFIDVLEHLKSAINYPVKDPKGIQGDLNKLTLEEIRKIYNKIEADLTLANDAIFYEMNAEMGKAIRDWGKIFGDSFPIYG